MTQKMPNFHDLAAHIDCQDDRVIFSELFRYFKCHFKNQKHMHLKLKVNFHGAATYKTAVKMY
jgi:hypothetical protein